MAFQGLGYLLRTVGAKAATAAARDLRTIGQAAGRGISNAGKWGWNALLEDAPGGRSINNAFTGKKIRPGAVKLTTAAALYWSIDQATENFVTARSIPDVLPMLTRSGNVIPGSTTSHDPLLGARGSLAFALHRMRHG